jgi:hypothetical protein
MSLCLPYRISLDSGLPTMNRQEPLKEEMTETEIKYSKYRSKLEPELFYKNKGYYVARNWGKTNYEKFIDIMSQRVPLLSYEIHK